MTAKRARALLTKLKGLITESALPLARAGMSVTGAGMFLPNLSGKRFKRIVFPSFTCGMILPKDDEIKNGAVIYIHGGGYVCGGLDYALGYASVLSKDTSLPVIFPAYRLAPENKCPAALKDCITTYKYAVNKLGIDPNRLIICGESAGGGLIYSLISALKAMKLPLPKALVAISPWVDLTLSGDSYEYNREKDPSMTFERLSYFAQSYTDDPTDPICSPLFSSLEGTPPSLIVSGGDEIMLSDALMLSEKLKNSGCTAIHHIENGMWHAYPLYNLSDKDCTYISEFIKEQVYEEKTSVDET